MDTIIISGFEMAETVARGNDFYVGFMIEAVHGIHNITVVVNAHGLPPAEEEVE